eukprot:TRINITY_DN40695_c0_g1_i1.p1 TRINITY_DN40695_c0_g1~~TRINITY_DN40695_c0_g1_i1.p1  ORF type:complete len:248 (-),score=29.50 TRINITY_DN40695_c0_g1_i1:266-1009(-)
MYAAPASGRSPLVRELTGEQRGRRVAKTLNEMPSGRAVSPGGCSVKSNMSAPCGRLGARRRPVAAAPWESLAVQQFAERCRGDLTGDSAVVGSGAAMVLQNGEGRTVLQALGEREDHAVAGRVVAEMSKRTNGGDVSRKHLMQRDRVSFGAVYEHRDMAGKPRLIGSTDVVPERQFQLDCQDNLVPKHLLNAGGGPGSSGHVVWVGMGRANVGEKEMAQVRQAVCDARAQRLQVEKLQSEKPYSRHF